MNGVINLMEEQPKLKIIGVLHGDIASREDAPKNYDESRRVGSFSSLTFPTQAA